MTFCETNPISLLDGLRSVPPVSSSSVRMLRVQAFGYRDQMPNLNRARGELWHRTAALLPHAKIA